MEMRKPKSNGIVRFILAVFVFSMLTPVAGVFLNLNKAHAAVGWFDAAWQYRRSLTVTNSSAQVLNNQQVNVTLNAANFSFAHAMTNGNDLRFTDEDGTTLINHWAEAYNAGGQSASLVVRVPQIAASSTKTFYLYYGNPTAQSASSGSKTFDFYDGFERLRNAATPLVTPTYDGSGQTVHPDVVQFPTAWNGYKYWMATTPYPGGNDQLENSSILASNDGLNWSVPAGAVNPLVPTPPCDHNNDSDMIYNDATGELWLYYLDTRRAARCSGHQSQPYYDHNYLKVIKSSDGIHWSAPTVVIDWPLANNGPLYVSPSIVKVGSTFYLWAVNSATFAVRTASSGNGLQWGPSQAVNLGTQAWHIDVEYIPSKNEFWAVSNYPSIPHGILRFARSSDRVNWTSYATPALSYTTGWDQGLYRSTFIYNAFTDQISLWYSANNNGSPLVWRTGYSSVAYSDLLNQLTSGGGWVREQGSGTWATSTTQVKRGALSAQLTQTTGTSLALSKPQPLPNNFYLESDIYDDLDTTAFKMLRSTNSADSRLGVGVWTGASANKYVFHNKAYAYTVTSVNRTAGWHKFGILLKADSSVAYFIDGQNVGTVSGQFANAAQIQVEGYTGGTTTYNIDDIRVRKWANPDVAVTVGAEEARPN